MYIYIYDSFVNEPRNQKVIANIETRITDLGLNGKIYRLGVIKSITNLLEEEIKKGAKTIIGVGNDFIFSQIINAIIKIGDNNNPMPIIGFIPIGKNNYIADYFGINSANAHAVISARRVKNYSLGKINNDYFLSNIKITSEGAILNVDNSYQIKLTKNNEAYVINLPVTPDLQEVVMKDKLKLYIQKKAKNYFSKSSETKTHISPKVINIVEANISALVDNNYFIKSPVTITSSEKQINIIISKDKKNI